MTKRRRFVPLLCAAALFLTSASILRSTSRIAKLREAYDATIRSVASRHGLEPKLIHAVITAESAYNRWAVSSAGAQGLMQLMPQTAAFYGVSDVFDVEQNIDAGVRYLKDLQNLYRGEADSAARLKKMLAAYNAGQEAVKKYSGIPPYAETRAYIDRVLDVYASSGARRKTIIIDFWTEDGKHVVTNVMTIAAARPSTTITPD